LINTLQQFWAKLRGNSDEFSLEARIFHAVCIISMAVAFVCVPLNIVNDLPGLAIFMAVLFILTAALFYLSRVQKQLTASVILFSVQSNLLFVANFYFNSGINGPTLLASLLALFLTIATVPKKQYFWWILLNITSVSALLVISYKEPELIQYTYDTNLSRHTDLGYTYILIALLIFLVTDYIRNSYNREKALTEQKASELQLSNDTKNKLLSILAHDLRSPLSSIQNYLEILSEFKMEEEEKQTIQASLLTETKNTQQMLSNLLSWSKTQMEGMTVHLSNINLKETLVPALRAQQAMAAEKCIQLENRISDSAFVLADSDMLQLVIRNLVNNAIKFTAAGGRVTVTSKLEDNQCIIMVGDNGSGIPYELQSNLFSLKARSTFGTHNEKGVGLGLALCKEFSEIQNGKIWFESAPGKGTTFFVGMSLSPAKAAKDTVSNALIS
jgi:two-component system sensor histidine kinase/response regulator